MKRNGAARTDEFRERFERHRTHSNILRTIDGRRKPKKTPGPDLTEKLPSCVRPPTQKGSLLRGGPGGGPRGGRLRDTGRRPRRGPRRSRREGHCPRGWWPKVFKCENANLKFISRSKLRRLLELFARVHPSCLEGAVTIWNLQAEQTTTSSSRELTESATKEKYEVASSEYSRSTRTNRWGTSKSPRTPQPQPQRQNRQSKIQPLDT